LLIEGKAALLDHLAVLPVDEMGVWDRDGPPVGVVSATAGDNAVADAAVEPAAKDADPLADPKNGEKLDKLLAFCDSMSTKMDTLGHKHDALAAKHDAMSERHDALAKRMDAIEAKGAAPMPDPAMIPAGDSAKKDKARKDASGGYLRKDGTACPQSIVDAAMAMRKDRKDAAEGDLEEAEIEAAEKAAKDAMMDDSARKDSATALAKAEEALRLARATQPLSDAESAKFAEVQSRYDAVHQIHGTQAPRAMQGESLLAYRRRNAGLFRQHNQAWKDIDLSILPDAALAIAENAICDSAREAGLHPTGGTDGRLVEVTRVDPRTGVRTTTFHGNRSIFESMKAPSLRATQFKTGNRAA
jgi:hypothetical protein